MRSAINRSMGVIHPISHGHNNCRTSDDRCETPASQSRTWRMFVNAATADAKWGLILCEIAEGPISGAFSLSAEEANSARLQHCVESWKDEIPNTG